ncbi:hypothetical protein J2858_000143 [Neorhizobium galegae]|uniref:hypothetical protein n=1 Tax=Rhizobium/Agrobacterium group TaxID=227290 RepID=UPI001AE9C0B4|nr:hypothetical protein [Neorhizobium galegae]MBP2547250.1 hypothetical protein [Neorhizobium galegae]
MRRLSIALCLVALASSAVAQTVQPSTETGRSTTTMAELVSREYEIKAAVPNGTKFIVFLQKGTSAYACEFVTLTKSRCGSVN